jgi:hypothetical protein
MKIGLIIQYATLFSMLIEALSIVVAVLINREQVKTQMMMLRVPGEVSSWRCTPSMTSYCRALRRASG